MEFGDAELEEDWHWDWDEDRDKDRDEDWDEDCDEELNKNCDIDPVLDCADKTIETDVAADKRECKAGVTGKNEDKTVVVVGKTDSRHFCFNQDTIQGGV